MKRIVIATIISAAGLMLFNCSSDRVTSPTGSSDVALSQAPGHEKVDVLIGVTGRDAANAITATGAQIRREYRHFPIIFASIPQTAIAGLLHNPNILYIEPDMTRTYSEQTLD